MQKELKKYQKMICVTNKTQTKCSYDNVPRPI